MFLLSYTSSNIFHSILYSLRINYHRIGMGDIDIKGNNHDSANSISSRVGSFVECSLGKSVNGLVFDNEVAKQVGPGGIIINSQKLVHRNGQNRKVGFSNGIGPKPFLGPNPYIRKLNRDGICLSKGPILLPTGSIQSKSFSNFSSFVTEETQ